jgi:hypothetical protein
MKTCPTCQAKLNGRRVCRRCRTDVGKIIDISQQAQSHDHAATQAYHEGQFKAMQFHAKRAFSLRQTAHSGRMLALAALLNHEYTLAVNTWLTLARLRRR